VEENIVRTDSPAHGAASYAGRARSRPEQLTCAPRGRRTLGKSPDDGYLRASVVNYQRGSLGWRAESR
jgi:hypothetical protein